MDTQKVYIFRNSVGLYKIGISVNPERRCKQMKLASGIDVVIIKVYEVEKPAIQIESLLHKHFPNLENTVNGLHLKISILLK